MSKPTVHYQTLLFVKVGSFALLYPVDHPNHLPEHKVSNNQEVTTSKVLSYDDQTGRIETLNTIYVPVEG